MNTIVDGYNLIFQCGLEGRSRSPISLERARDRLIKLLALAFSEQLSSITIVFDARTLPIKETEAVSQKDGVTVMYAIDHEDADSLIEELIRKNSTPKQLTVVSSDHRIHKAALRRKAKPIDSDVWFDWLNSRQNQRESPSNSVKSKQEIIESEQLHDIDWASEFNVNPPPPAKVGDGKTAKSKPTAFDPFPPGYTDDLDDELRDEN